MKNERTQLMQSNLGLIGLSTMGGNIARNIADKGFKISVYNRSKEKTLDLIKKDANKNLIPIFDMKTFVSGVKTPRNIMLMVKAGEAVDQLINQLIPLISKGDTIIDLGNSNYEDTIRREKFLREKGVSFLGVGVSGGEEGALNGPSIMPGGDKKSYSNLEKVFNKIAAKDFKGDSCVTYIGKDGSGHYVKMVHNGIEYAIMQIMAEGYDILRKLYGLKSDQIADIFEDFNKGELNSYLFKISISVLREKDDLTKGFLIDNILDQAEQKGTGRWTAIDGLKRGVVISAISEAVNARITSSKKEKRTILANMYKSKFPKKQHLNEFIPELKKALYSAILLAYAQGYELMENAKKEQKWKLDFSEISRIWQGGCIIRAEILDLLKKSFKQNPDTSLLEIKEIQKIISDRILSLRIVIKEGVMGEVPVPVLSSTLAYFDQIKSKDLPANFIQGLRDFFGAHTYHRVDRKGIFHTKWE